MKILQVCKKFPWPARDGESIAIYNLTRGFAQAGHEVTVLAMNTPKHRFDPGFLPDSVRQVAQFYAIDVDTEVRALPALLNLFTNQSYNLERFFSRDFKEGLHGLIRSNKFDLIQLEGLYLGPYFQTIRLATHAPVVMRAHNVEFEIWEKLAKGERRAWRRWYLNLLARRLRKFETSSLGAFSALVPISPIDEKRFRQLGANLPIHTSPAGIHPPDFAEPTNAPSPNTLGYLGALDWAANREGLDWFLDQCWPGLKAERPELRFLIAGRNAPLNWPGRTFPGVEFLGEVEHAAAFLNSVEVVVLPLLSGSGMRIKLLEALALGKPVVATSQAAEGVDLVSGTHGVLADSAALFNQAILHFLRQPDEARRQGREGQRMVREVYDQEKIVYKLLDFYNQQFFV
ncbi:MAG: glycosyltransferase [Bacteroidetes bacterium]|nr:glycosyltransferase [Bacteroidota bacterium]